MASEDEFVFISCQRCNQNQHQNGNRQHPNGNDEGNNDHDPQHLNGNDNVLNRTITEITL